MTSFAVAHLRNVTMGPDIVAYLTAIDATLAPFQGQFVVHGSDKQALEGKWPGDLVIISFPDRQTASAWYSSPAYQAILPLRTGNSEGDIILVDCVEDDHRATDILLA
jgi:uncharacterized protein (DUF1330 family)